MLAWESMSGLLVTSVVLFFFACSVLISRVRSARAGLGGGLLDGRGIVLWADKTSTKRTIGGLRYEMRAIRLDVEVPGREPYEVSLSPLIPRICEALPGSPLDVRVDPRNPQNVTIVGPSGSIGWMDAMPGLFLVGRYRVEVLKARRLAWIIMLFSAALVTGLMALAAWQKSSEEASTLSGHSSSIQMTHPFRETSATRTVLPFRRRAQRRRNRRVWHRRGRFGVRFEVLDDATCKSALAAEKTTAAELHKQCQ